MMLTGNVINHGIDGINPSGPGLIAQNQTQPPPDGTQQYCLRWNSYPATIATQLATLKVEEDFVDVTLTCEGQQLRAHKLVLSACSPYFMQMFKSTPCQHPVVFLRDVRFCQLRALLEFMYAGEVNVSQSDLPALLRTAEALQVRGLADTTNDNNFVNHLPQHKPIYPLSQQYTPLSNPSVAEIPNLHVPAAQMTPQLQQPPHVTDTENTEMAATLVAHAQPPNPQHLLQMSALPESRNRDVTANESSKENQIDDSSSDSNDSQEDYVDGSQFDGKNNSNQEQILSQNVLPLTATNNSFASIGTPGDVVEGSLTGVGPESWNSGLESMSLDGSPSEAEISDEDNNGDDGEIKEDFILSLPSHISAYQSQAPVPGENKTNAQTDSVFTTIPSAGSCPNNSIPFQSTIPDKSKDLTSNSNPPNNIPPRNRFSRGLFPPYHEPGVPYHGPQQCPYCTRVLSNVGNWRKHVYTMHISREKNFKCCHCKSSFRTSEYLQKHYVRVHSYAPKMSRKKGMGNTTGISSTSNNQNLPGPTALTNMSQIP